MIKGMKPLSSRVVKNVLGRRIKRDKRSKNQKPMGDPGVCYNCGTYPINPYKVFCPKCEKQQITISEICEDCETKRPAFDKFCPKCGK